jgi:hypothetical protein
VGGGGEPGRVQADLSEDHLRLAYTFPSRSPGPTHPDAGRGGLDGTGGACATAGMESGWISSMLRVSSDLSPLRQFQRRGCRRWTGCTPREGPGWHNQPFLASRDWLSPMKSAS